MSKKERNFDLRSFFKLLRPKKERKPKMFPIWIFLAAEKQTKEARMLLSHLLIFYGPFQCDL